MSQVSDHHRGVIMAFVTQQFWNPPDSLVNRYNTKSLKVERSEKVIDAMVDLLLKFSSNCCRNADINSYVVFIRNASEELGIDDESTVKVVQDKLSQLKTEMNIDDPDIFFTTAIGCLLGGFHSKIITRYSLWLKKVNMSELPAETISKRLDYLSQKSDEDLSLYFNLEILKDMSRNTGIALGNYDDKQLQKSLLQKLRDISITEEQSD